MWNDIVSWQKRRLNNSTKYPTPCIDDHHFKEEELKSVGELSKVCSQKCSEMLVLGTYWKTRFSMVCKQARTIHHKMDEGL